VFAPTFPLVFALLSQFQQCDKKTAFATHSNIAQFFAGGCVLVVEMHAVLSIYFLALVRGWICFLLEVGVNTAHLWATLLSVLNNFAHRCEYCANIGR
jgi:hypothetical protein